MMSKEQITTKQDFKEAVKAAYRLGLMDGENQYIRVLNVIEKTHHHLFEQLRVLDLRSPDKANSVYFSRGYLERLVALLKKRGIYYKANQIQRIIKSQLGETLSAEAKLRELLSEIEEEE